MNIKKFLAFIFQRIFRLLKRDKMSFINLFEIQLKCLKFIGYQLDFVEQNIWKNVFVIFNILTILLALPFELHFFFVNFDQVQLCTEVLGTALTCVLALTKLITFYCKKPMFMELISDIKQLTVKQGNHE